MEISAANTNDDLVFEQLIDGIQPIRGRTGRPRKRPVKLHADKGYNYAACHALLRRRGIIARIARQGIESSKHLGKHQYVIERALEWVSRFRRLRRRYERKASRFLAFARLAPAPPPNHQN